MTMFTDVPAPASLQSVGRPTQYILPPVSHLTDMQHVALCTFANTTCTNPGLTLPGINVQPCCSSPKAPTLPSSPGPGHHLPRQLAADAEPSPSCGKPEVHGFLERNTRGNQWQRLRQYHTPRDGNAGTPALATTALLSPQRHDCCPERLASITAWIFTSSSMEQPVAPAGSNRWHA